MSKTEGQHTPGPWKWVGGQDPIDAGKFGDQTVIEISVDTGDFSNGYSIIVEASDADARLIAAAPDLLEALGHDGYPSIAKILRAHDYNFEADRIDAAISKATTPTGKE